MNFLVTVKLAKNPEHNPREKKTGPCPVNGKPCTDVTGEHHTFLVDFDGHTLHGREMDAEGVREFYRDRYHVTRVETV
jgi:hypothetical protein